MWELSLPEGMPVKEQYNISTNSYNSWFVKDKVTESAQDCNGKGVLIATRSKNRSLICPWLYRPFPPQWEK
jgi:hypothetical protein